MSDKKMTRGTAQATACPHCGRANDFRGLADYGLEPGNTILCDHCGGKMKLMKKNAVTILYLRAV